MLQLRVMVPGQGGVTLAGEKRLWPRGQGQRLDAALRERMGWKGCAGMQGADHLVWSEKDARCGFALGVTLGLAQGGAQWKVRCPVEGELPFSFGIGTQDAVRGLCSRYPWPSSNNTGLRAQKWFSAKY